MTDKKEFKAFAFYMLLSVAGLAIYVLKEGLTGVAGWLLSGQLMLVLGAVIAWQKSKLK